MIKYSFIILIIFNGCYKVGHQDWLDYRNNYIGKRIFYNDKAPDKYHSSGKIIRGNYLLSGQGLTYITKDNKGNLFYHIDGSEILPVFYDTSKPKWLRKDKNWIGKCKFYYIVDPKTKIIKGWEFEKDANPLSCRRWP